MWHLKTKMGTFWILPLHDSKHAYVLGVNDDELAFYTDIEKAAKDVREQATGFLRWDTERVVKAPEHISEWANGEPQEWRKI